MTQLKEGNTLHQTNTAETNLAPEVRDVNTNDVSTPDAPIKKHEGVKLSSKAEAIKLNTRQISYFANTARKIELAKGSPLTDRMDEKNIKQLQKHVTESGKILPAKGKNRKLQKKIAKAIKRSRILGLIK